jgi:hypothetical protein
MAEMGWVLSSVLGDERVDFSEAGRLVPVLTVAPKPSSAIEMAAA